MKPLTKTKLVRATCLTTTLCAVIGLAAHNGKDWMQYVYFVALFLNAYWLTSAWMPPTALERQSEDPRSDT
jgi:hypothetical protein